MSICVLGSVNQDLVLRVTDLPLPGETVSALATSAHLGGKGANQAVAVARMGKSPTFIGATGRDAAADWMRDQLAAEGIDSGTLASVENVPSGQAFVMVSDHGENSIVVVGGANLAVTPQHVSETVVIDHRVFLAQLETPTDVIAALFTHPSARSGLKILNAAPAVAQARELLHLVDILVVNETELASYAGCVVVKEETTSVIEAARSLINRVGQSVVVTLGAAGLAIVTKEHATRVLGHRVDVVDTTGAGDCFCGVLAAELARGISLEEAAQFANAASALAVTRLGASSSAPTRLEVEIFLREQRWLSPSKL